MWKNIVAAPADSILGITEAFKKNENPDKVNLGVGVYMDDNGTTPVLSCVKEAERILLESQQSKSYLPIAGDPIYSDCVQRLIFGAGSEVVASDRAATAHTPGGTGALRIGAELVKAFKPKATAWLSSPTWANHNGIFGTVGFPLARYPYYSETTKGLKYDEMLTTLERIPAGDVVLMHACCHNPSGVDPDAGQWAEIARIAHDKGWLPILDFAYQGFGDGVEQDRICIEEFAKTGCDFFVAGSFSKNFGLYNERTGFLTVVGGNAAETAVALSHLKKTVRVCYSNPPAHGGLIVKTILSNPGLKASWLNELADMCRRIVTMRAALVDGLAARGINHDFSYIKAQRGMFSFIGLSDDVVAWLRAHKAIYVVDGGRINIAGLTRANIDYVCDSIAEALG